VTTDASGDATARVTVARAEPGSWITATSTNRSTGSTSEFSSAVRVAERSVLGRRTDYGDAPAAPVPAAPAPVEVSEPIRRLLSPRRLVYELA
jgi:hypothetical protein